MKNLGLQNIIMVVFIASAIIALIAFSGFVDIGGGNSDEPSGSVLVWGTIPNTVMQPFIDRIENNDLTVTYRAQDSETYESDLINAIAAGRGPDLFIMPHEEILRNKDKIFEIPYGSFPRRDYTSRYIRESELFLTDTGILALPLSVDPLVMYYNKNLMNSAFILDVPEFWDEVLQFVPQITVRDSNGRVSLSGAALGTFDNIDSAKELLSILMIQNGNRLVDVDPTSGKYRSTLALDQVQTAATQQSLDFYTSFAQIGNANYSWNEALAPSLDTFISGDLALYFGRASELTDIRRKNSNLDFDVALLPQVRGNRRTATFGYMRGVAVSKQSNNVQGALVIASQLAGQEIAGELSTSLGEVPARVDLLGQRPEEEYLNLFYNSAIIADGWVDPAPDQTDSLIRQLIRNVNTGALSSQDSVMRIHTSLNELLERTINTTVEDRNLQGLEG